MKIGEIQISEGAEGWQPEWLVLYRRDGFLSFSIEYQNSRTGERESYQDSGLAVNDEHLDLVIDLLVKARSVVAQKGEVER